MGDRQHVHRAVRETSQGARGAGISGILLLPDAHNVAGGMNIQVAMNITDY